MNYRHAFHAGSFADVVKHAILTRVLVHLRGKTAPFRVIDIHAGDGLYDLASEEAGRTGEWPDRPRIRRQWCRPPRLNAPISPRCVVQCGWCAAPLSRLAAARWPVSCGPRIASRLQARAGRSVALAHRLRVRRAVAIGIPTKRVAASAYVPPNERRGLVVLDPPTAADDFRRASPPVSPPHTLADRHLQRGIRSGPTDRRLPRRPAAQRHRASARNDGRFARCRQPSRRLRPRRGQPPWRLQSSQSLGAWATCSRVARPRDRPWIAP
jgi:hypothetical protein